jgi:hypothetical protein
MDTGKSLTRLESSLGQVSYRLRYLAVYGVFLAAFLPAGIKKVSQPVPDSIVTQFSTTWIATFPGTKVSWVVMGIAELVVSALFVISLVTLEWNSAARKAWIKLALSAGAIAFMILAAGEDFSDQFSSAASLFAYLAGTIVVWLMVKRDERDDALGRGR